ncbi:MAG: hypothetical protein PVJ66_07010 [Gammaproteobacteria bacterium]|jgi:hypothetical protein
MIQLTRALQAWNSTAFEAVLREEIQRLDATSLPLQQGLVQGSYAFDDNLGVSIISVSESAAFIHVTAGIHYRGIIAGCSCADDPTPVNETTEYCEIRLDIDRQTAGTTIRLLP